MHYLTRWQDLRYNEQMWNESRLRPPTSSSDASCRLGPSLTNQPSSSSSWSWRQVNQSEFPPECWECRYAHQHQINFFLFLAFHSFFFRSEGVIKEVSPMMRWWKWKHFHGGCLDGYIFVCNEEDLLFLSILSPSTFLVVAMNVLPEIRWDMKSLSATSSWTLWIHACIS